MTGKTKWPEWTSPDGRIRLICGDALEVRDSLPPIDAIIADPPYGIRYSHGGSSGVLAKTTRFVGVKIAGDDKPFDPAPWLDFPIVVLWGANHYAERLPSRSKWLVWDKRDGVTSNDQADCELAWTNSTKPARLFSHRWMGMLKASERGQTRLHPMQKPVAAIEWAMEQVDVPDDALVCDPYAGVATTAVACNRTNRRCICIEQDPGYFAKGIDRLKAEYARTALFDGAVA
jgi:site-specific DNA-methyltransferase (adenine-specific)